jgi:hypothetical protein
MNGAHQGLPAGHSNVHLPKLLLFLENLKLPGRLTCVSLPFFQESLQLCTLFVQQLGEWEATPGCKGCVGEVGGLLGGDSPPTAFGYGFSGPVSMIL